MRPRSLFHSTYSTNDAYAVNAYVNDQFDFKTYLCCAEYEVTDEDTALGLHARWGSASTTISKISVFIMLITS